MGTWGWAALGVLAALGVYAVATRKKEPEGKDLCIKDLPGQFKKDALNVISKGDVDLIDSFAQQADAKGWHCAAKELRLEAKKRSRPAAELTIDDISEPPRVSWKKLIERSQTEDSGQLVIDLQKAAQEADTKDWLKVVALLDAATLRVKARVAVNDIRDESLLKEKPAEGFFAPTAEQDAYAVKLKAAGYTKAAKQVQDASDAVKAALEKAECYALIEELPTDLPFHVGSDTTYQPRDLRVWLHEVVTKSSDVVAYGATFLYTIAARWDAIDFGSSDKISINHGTAYRNAADCLNTLAAAKALGGM